MGLRMGHLKKTWAAIRFFICCLAQQSNGWRSQGKPEPRSLSPKLEVRIVTETWYRTSSWSRPAKSWLRKGWTAKNFLP